MRTNGDYKCLMIDVLSTATFCLRCFDAVGWAAGRASGL